MDQIVLKKKPHEATRERPRLPGQVVLVFQGGGALGAYQGGVYQALHEAGIEPDWVVGTSIGALNGALIVGNDVASRLERFSAEARPWMRSNRMAASMSPSDSSRALFASIMPTPVACRRFCTSFAVVVTLGSPLE